MNQPWASASCAKKGGGGGSAATAKRPATNDVVPRGTMEKRLREVPVFGLLQPGAQEALENFEGGSEPRFDP